MSDKVDLLYLYKKSFDLCTNAFSQYVVLDYLRNNDLNEVIKCKTKTYKTLLKKSIKKLNSNYKNRIEYYSIPIWGLFYLVKFKDKISEDEFEDGSSYFINRKANNATRINICSEL